MTITRRNAAREFFISTYGNKYANLKFTVVLATRLANGELDWKNRRVLLLAMNRATLSKLISYSDEPGTEVFYTPVPRTAKGDPSVDNSGDGYSIYADVDKRVLDAAVRNWLRMNGFSLIRSGGVVVGEDGQKYPRFHVHLGLSSSTPPREVEELNAALAAKLGADSKTSSAALLRVPGTRNWKPENIGANGRGALVAVASLSYRSLSVSELHQALGTDASSTSAPVRTQSKHEAPTEPVKTSRRERGGRVNATLTGFNGMYKEGTRTNRHGLLMGLVKDCIRAGLTLEQTWGVAEELDAAQDKAAEEGTTVLSQVIKAWNSTPAEQVRAELATADSVAERLAGTQAAEPKRSTSRFLTRQQLRERPEPRWLIERLLPEYGVGQLFGPSYGGKTYAAVDLSMRLCTGMDDWIGQKINGKGSVFYVLMEGGFDFAKRLDAWEMKYGRTSDELSVMVEEELNLADPDSVEALAADVEATSSTPALLVIDTQSLAVRGVDENDNTGMNEVMQSLKALSKRLNCFILLVHHTGHENGDRARGASSQPAALDVIIRIRSSEDKGRHIDVTKVKAGREIKAVEFRLEEQRNGAPAFTVMTAAESVAAHLSNEDRIVAYIRENATDGPVHPNDIAKALGLGESTVRAHCGTLADEAKCMKGQRPPLVVHKIRRQVLYAVAE
ncbi:helicase RepA family protein [Streptomyces sp. NBC_01214]|uniref:AAA family ATPase n=1 Tax=Streptomyces sp. NBC_01214 TaxID=2903777 RepID=UPI0022548710|nr:AAA family ATPase [Streptomyces sp. NBC_01214]MCX4800578.1 helicase RepA family protein [Streptomyces sp. NBC_01214]